MSVTVSPPSHTWAATHRLLLALVTVAVAVAAVVVIVLTTSGSSSSSSVQAPDRPVPTIPGPADPQQPDIPRHCLQHMGLQYMALVPC